MVAHAILREGKTPTFVWPKQARELLEFIDTGHVVGLRVERQGKN